MTGELLALGANHKTAPLPLREKLALPDGRAARVMAELVGHDAVHEAVAISTCNRTELYLVTADPVEAENLALGILSRQAGLRPTELLGVIYSLQVFDLVYVMTRIDQTNTLPTVVYYIYEEGFRNFRMGYAITVAWVLLAIILVFTLIQFRLQKRWVFYS